MSRIRKNKFISDFRTLVTKLSIGRDADATLGAGSLDDAAG